MRRALPSSHPPRVLCPCLQTLDERIKDGRTPLWAERMNLKGGPQGEQRATVYDYRQEYLPTQKTEARSMVGGWVGGWVGGKWINGVEGGKPAKGTGGRGWGRRLARCLLSAPHTAAVLLMLMLMLPLCLCNTSGTLCCRC